uniref:G protein-coupled receptor n=1 Tax=Caenorhabditis tropicalis TaxID=1561998 RepID=A0A1I7U6J3_9PELO
MGAFDRVKAQVASDSKWTSSPYKGFVAGSPSSTYVDVVSTAFEDATNTMNFARHSKFDEMYTPYLGSFRERHNYTSIAPSLCINQPKGKLRYFQGEYLIGWLLIPGIVGFIWTAVTVYFCAPNEITMEYSKELMMDHYQIDLDNVTHIGSIYFIKDKNGKSIPNEFALLGMGILFSIMGVSLSILGFFAIKCYKRIKTLIYEGESTYTRNLQRQLYKALVAQATIPMLFIFMPVGLYLTLPLVGIQLEISGEIVTFVYALYPALDPLPIIFIIDNYRFAIFDFLGCHPNRVNADDELTSVSRHISNCS